MLIEDFIAPGWRERILAAMESATGAAAGVYGRGTEGRIEPAVRSVQLLDVSAEIRDFVLSRFEEARERLAGKFGVALSSFEEPKFLRYGTGDHFVAHQDGNTPVLHDDSRHRRVSVVAFLNDAYEGGALVLHGAYPNYSERFVVPAVPGALAAFRSETTHEVTPVTSGVRYTIVSWFRG
jgi:SM-20-related protein